MNTSRPLAADPCSLLDSLLGQAFEFAIAQRRHETAEIILQAMESHAEETGDGTALDAAYLRSIRSVTAPSPSPSPSPSPGSMVKGTRRCPWRLRS